jgi:hypothetical protein
MADALPIKRLLGFFSRFSSTDTLATALYSNISPVTSTRTLNTVFQPSTTRPVLLIYTIRITTSTGGSAEGLVQLLSDTSNPPTTVRCSVDNGNGIAGISLATISSFQNGVLVYMVPPNQYVKLLTTNVSGTPSFMLEQQTEISL